MDNNRGWGGVVEMGGKWGELGVRLGCGEKAENCTSITIKLKNLKKE